MLRINSVKGLAVRFFAALRMTVLRGSVGKCTNIFKSGLVQDLIPFSQIVYPGFPRKPASFTQANGKRQRTYTPTTPSPFPVIHFAAFTMCSVAIPYRW